MSKSPLTESFMINLVNVETYFFSKEKTCIEVLCIEEAGTTEVRYVLEFEQVYYFQYFQYQKSDEFSVLDVYQERLEVTEYAALQNFKNENRRDQWVLRFYSAEETIIVGFAQIQVVKLE